MARIRPLLSNLISPFQAAFVPGRRGIDNVIIAQELIHSLHKKKGLLGSFVVKIDLKKAYDRLEWSFILEVLLFFHFPRHLISLIMDCVSSSTISILFNGGRLDEFSPSRGIRQGDPLSPYLFILCMEYLSLRIFEACANKNWKSIKASRSGPSFSHLFFADDLLLFADASENCCRTIIAVLDDFCSCSGQKINLSKSKVLFSPNVKPDVASRLCRILGVSSTQDIGKYLGFPLRSNGRNSRDFNFIVEKVQSKLTSWKSKLLSPAGRVVLIQSVTSSLPAYYMQNTALPSTICNDLDRLNRNFLWGSTNESKKMHLVGWDKVCRPKRDGGLGLHATKPRNKALLAKLNWRLHDEKDSWWARTLTAKYCPNGITSFPLPIHRGGSSNWRGLKLGHEVFRNGLRWVVNNGQHVSFWNDRWVGDHALREVVHGPLSLEESSFRICDLIEGTSFWDFSKLSIGIPPPICAQIKSIHLYTLSHLEDCIVWDTVDGSFSLRKAYQIACKPSHSLDCLGSSTWLWHTVTTPRIQFFLW